MITILLGYFFQNNFADENLLNSETFRMTKRKIIAEDEMDIPEKIDPHGPIITLGIESEEVNWFLSKKKLS